MKKVNTVLAASALSAVAVSSQAALIDVTISLSGTLTGPDSGTISGSFAGTYNTDNGQILASGTQQTATGYTNAFITSDIDVDAAAGTSTATACTNNGGAIDICAGNTIYGVPPLPICVPGDMGLTDFSVDGTGNGTFSTSQSNSGVTISSTYTVSAVPVPAAAWLFGSALVGLAGIGRKRG